MSFQTRLVYAELQVISKQFKTDADDIKALLDQTKQKVETLHGGMWVGQAADKFFDEMENTVMPGLTRLVAALHKSGAVTDQIAQTFTNADEETKNYFHI